MNKIFVCFSILIIYIQCRDEVGWPKELKKKWAIERNVCHIHVMRNVRIKCRTPYKLKGTPYKVKITITIHFIK